MVSRTLLEAKLRTTDTSATAEAKKIKILSMNFSPLAYDFERARKTGRSGFVTDNFSSDFTTDLLPGFSGGVVWSLYQGNVMSDSARFKPFRERIDASFTINSQSGIFGALSRVFGRPVPQKNPQMERVEASGDDALANRVANTPVAGISSRNSQFSVPETQGWQATLTFSSSRQRPPTGDGVFVQDDPTVNCLPFQSNAIIYQQCIEREIANSGGGIGISANNRRRCVHNHAPEGEPEFPDDVQHHSQVVGRSGAPTTTSRRKKFGSHPVSLQRALHDWRAIFAFTQAPNGNFAFNFFIALNAEPDLKFNYDKQTYRPVKPLT